MKNPKIKIAINAYDHIVFTANEDNTIHLSAENKDFGIMGITELSKEQKQEIIIWLVNSL